MSKSFSHNDLCSLFGRNITNNVKKSTAVEVEKEPTDKQYKGANRTLLHKIQELNQTLAEAQKTITQLNKENEILRGKVCALENNSLEDCLEIVVNERVQRKLAHFNTIMEKAKTSALQYVGLMESISQEITIDFPCPEKSIIKGSNSKKPIIAKPSVEKIEELPIRSINTKARRKVTFLPFDPDETPKAERRTKPVMIDLETTPKAQMSFDAMSDSDNSMYATPMASPGSKPIETPLTNTGRVKRTAVAKIRTLAEPSRRVKMRNPGKKYEDASPFIGH